MYKAIAVLAQDYWCIEVIVSIQETEEQAKIVLSCIENFAFVLIRGRSAIKAYLDGNAVYYFDEDIVVKEISQNKQSQLGRPLDSRNENDVEIALTALLTEDPAYIIAEEDFVPSCLTLLETIHF